MNGNVNQTFQIIGDVPWPFAVREVFLQTQVVDHIDAEGFFAMILCTPDNDKDTPVVPGAADLKRIDCKGAMHFRPRPLDHPVIASRSQSNGPMILVSFKM